MAHELWLAINSFVEIGKEDAIFTVNQDNDLLGELRVSKGAVVWYPKGGKIGYKLEWSRFARLMKAEGVRAERR